MAAQTEPMKPPTTPRKGRRTGVATELSVLLKVKPGRERRIRDELTTAIADPVEHTEGQRILEDIGTVHEVRYVLFDDDTQFLLATSFDGDWDVYIDDFFRTKVLTYWASFLIHCEGGPDDLAGAAAW